MGPTEEDAIWAELGPLLLLLGDVGRAGSFAFRSRQRVFTRPLLMLEGWSTSSGPAELELEVAGPEAPAPGALSALWPAGDSFAEIIEGARLPASAAAGRGRWGGVSCATSSEKDRRFKGVVPVMSRGGAPRGLRLR